MQLRCNRLYKVYFEKTAMPSKITSLIRREWLLSLAFIGLLLSSISTKQLPAFSAGEAEVLIILAGLFIAVKGLQDSGVIQRISIHLQQGKLIALKLVLATFFLSMLVTNDVALIVVVPITLLLKTTRRDLLVILEVIAANAGSALTPIGNPQNLFIYWHYQVPPAEFLMSIAPLCLLFLLLLITFSCLIRLPNTHSPEPLTAVNRQQLIIYLLLLITAVLVVFHALPFYCIGLIFLSGLLLYKKTLCIDYGLLLTFVCLFGIADNLKVFLSTEIHSAGQTFIYSALISQIISNVPATLLIANFSNHWQALLWGSTVGGFGSLVGSLANLIAYKLYIADNSTENTLAFTVKFLALGYCAFFSSVGLYLLLF